MCWGSLVGEASFHSQGSAGSGGVRIHGAGCSLVDNLYNKVSFESVEFRRYASRSAGDGGLVAGELVFAEDLAAFGGKEYQAILREITGRTEPDHYNVGGPAIVPLVHAAQIFAEGEHRVAFSGVLGDDVNGERILNTLSAVPIDLTAYRSIEGPTPATDVLSDPGYDRGRGERTFINKLGAAVSPRAGEFSDSFFRGDIVFFGGTALVPPVHDKLTELSARARADGSLVVLSTVYDFRNQKSRPEAPWPLVDDYRLVDLVVTDLVEALRITGEGEARAAVDWFISRGAGGAVVTRGPEPVVFAASDSCFEAASLSELPVCRSIDAERRRHSRAYDTTGCGDNFLGGVLVSLASQLSERRRSFDLSRVVAEGNIAGGYAATYLGGLYHEAKPGDKKREIERVRRAYQEEVKSLVRL
jgi:sugar/nucleoside kinase (ribokinase family)